MQVKYEITAVFTTFLALFLYFTAIVTGQWLVLDVTTQPIVPIQRTIISNEMMGLFRMCKRIGSAEWQCSSINLDCVMSFGGTRLPDDIGQVGNIHNCNLVNASRALVLVAVLALTMSLVYQIAYLCLFCQTYGRYLTVTLSSLAVGFGVLALFLFSFERKRHAPDLSPPTQELNAIIGSASKLGFSYSLYALSTAIASFGVLVLVGCQDPRISRG